MPAQARLFPPSPKPAGGLVSRPVRALRVKFARAARDPRFQKVMTQLRESARKVGTHPPAARKAAEAQAAAKAPPNEKVAGARANQVDEISEAKAAKADKGGFLATLRAAIDRVMPKNLDDADKFMKGGESEQVKSTVGSNVSQQKQQAAGPTETATKAPPDTGKVEGKEVAALPADPAAVAPPVPGAEATPLPKTAAEVEKPAGDASASADQKMKDAELTQGQLTKANDPRFSSVLTARDKAKATAQAGPAKFRASEQQTLGQAKAGAAAATGRGLLSLTVVKTATGGKTKTRQQLAKEKDEAERKKVTDTIAGIFDKTKAKVDQKLSTLEADALRLFDAGSEAALANMKSSANQEIDRFKEDRYSGLIGKGRWFRDLFRDTPPEIKAIIARSRARFTVEMDNVAVRVAAIVDGRLAEAKAIVTAGQAEVKRYVAGLGPSLRAVGQKAQQEVAARFDELRGSIDEKANDLADKLADKYKEASEKADAAAKEMEEANKGALKGLADKIGEIIKILAEFADRVVSLFKKAAGVVKKIIADPIGFLGNLLSAIKQGIGKFVTNIWTHIKKGFMTWLFGELTKAGVEIPADLSLPSILKLTLGVLGLTWANLRPKVVKRVGERAVAFLEKVVEILQKLFTAGPAALWAEMQAFLGNLKEMVLDAILDWVITKIITSAITKIATMFNPAGAIIQAIIMVYNVGSWLAANLSRILDFIESVVSSVDRIANGDVGGASSFIEQALARMIPILIGFLASLIGLGGLAAKIKGFIQKVQARVSKAVDTVIEKVVNAVKKIIGKVTGKGKADERSPDADVQKRWTDGMKEVDAHKARHAGKETDQKSFKTGLASIKSKYQFTKLELIRQGGGFAIDAALNPAKVGTVDDSTLLETDKLVPLDPPGALPPLNKRFEGSARGNVHWYCTDSKLRTWYWRPQSRHPTAGRWIEADANKQKQKEAEEALRAKIANDNPGYISLVDPTKDLTAPGLDAAGFAPGRTEAEDRVILGEAKFLGGSRPQGVKYVPPAQVGTLQPSGRRRDNPLSATTDNLGRNLATATGRVAEAQIRRVTSALKGGRVTVLYGLAGQATLSASKRSQIEARIKLELTTFLKGPPYSLTPDEINQVIGNVVVSTVKL